MMTISLSGFRGIHIPSASTPSTTIIKWGCNVPSGRNSRSFTSG